MCVLNLTEYTSTDGNAASSYIANHLDVDVADIDKLNELASAADPDVLKAFIDSQLDFEHIAAWVSDNEYRLQQLSELVSAKSGQGGSASLAETLAAVGTLSDLSADEVALIAAFSAQGQIASNV